MLLRRGELPNTHPRAGANSHAGAPTDAAATADDYARPADVLTGASAAVPDVAMQEWHSDAVR